MLIGRLEIMSTIPSAALLDAWERGLEASPGERGLMLLALSYPDEPEATIVGMPVGRRDAALIALFERLFGSRFAAQAECPRCGAALQADFLTSTFAAPVCEAAPERLMFEHAGRQFAYRLPNAGDLASFAEPEIAAANEEAKRTWLLRRCLLAIDHSDGDGAGAKVSSAADGLTTIPDDLLPRLEQAIAGAAAALDPLSDIELALDCPECAHAWRSPFDILTFLWSALDEWAKRMLAEIHILALHYGWSEAEILGLSAHRRRRYRGLIGL